MEPDYALLIMCGLPLSGKTTQAAGFKTLRGYTIVSPDTVRQALHGGEFIPSAEGFVWATAETAVRALLMDGHKVLVDATNNTAERRKTWLRIAKDFGIPLQVSYQPTPAEECIRRAESAGREYMIPIIERMAENFEEPDERAERGIELLSESFPTAAG